ncbi:MAG: hypothetical protein DMG05_08225 [Acidobacteria bacterium]|nr:MAG: hypothetical protein DMG05_08225 [Acidobacteriota bacterium]
MLARFGLFIIGIGVFTSPNLNSLGHERLKLLSLTKAGSPPIRGSGFLSQSSSKNNRDQRYKYRVLATKKTSTMEKELNEAAEEGFKFEGVMGGETAFGGSEVVVVMSRDTSLERKGTYEYKLLATNRTSTVQKELQQAADFGFEYLGQTVFETTFGGKEVVVIMERDREAEIVHYEYKLLATSKTSTMQKELSQAGEDGYSFVGMTVAQTAFGGQELVVILRKPGSR